MHKIQWEIHNLLQTEQNGAFIGFFEWQSCITTVYPDAPVQLHIWIDRPSQADSCNLAVITIQESQVMTIAYRWAHQLN